MSPASPHINGVGAVDLAGLKNAPSEAQENAAIQQALSDLNLVCDCGSTIERGGQEIVVVAVGVVPTPRGPQRGMNVNRRAFCSVTCDHFEAFKRAAMSAQTLLVVGRPLPANTWFKKPSEISEAE